MDWLKALAKAMAEPNLHRQRQDRIEQDLQQNWYTAKEVAQMRGVSEQTVYNWIRGGKLQASEPPSGIIVHKSDLAKFLATPARKNSRNSSQAGNTISVEETDEEE